MDISRYRSCITGALVIAFITVLSVTDLDARQGQKGYHVSNPGIYHLNRMQERLTLTDSQVDKIFAIDTKYREKSFKNRKDPDTLRSIRDERRKEIEKVLTPEQREKYRNWRKGNDGHRHKKRNRPGR